jgi:cell division protein FtsL
MKSPVALYRIFQRADGEAPSLRKAVLCLVAGAVVLTAIGIVRVAQQHEVLRLGFALSRSSEQVGRMREARRALELELATLRAPERIRRLASQLGMAPVSPDRIRVVRRPADPAALAPSTAPTRAAISTAPGAAIHTERAP